MNIAILAVGLANLGATLTMAFKLAQAKSDMEKQMQQMRQRTNANLKKLSEMEF